MTVAEEATHESPAIMILLFTAHCVERVTAVVYCQVSDVSQYFVHYLGFFCMQSVIEDRQT